jgi:hypothetical protein
MFAIASTSGRVFIFRIANYFRGDVGGAMVDPRWMVSR